MTADVNSCIKYFIYKFTFIPHGFIRTHKRPAPNVSGFIAQLVRGHLVKVLDFSGFYIHNCINCVHNYEDDSLLDNMLSFDVFFSFLLIGRELTT